MYQSRIEEAVPDGVFPTKPLVTSLCDQINGVKKYNTPPKPVIVPTMTNKRVRNTFVLQSHRLEQQRSRSNLDVTLNRKTISLLNNMHKPNILKCRNAKMNMKRPAAEKLLTNECKQTRLTPDVNGFILHADVSESAEAPPSDGSIQEKIAMMNMK